MKNSDLISFAKQLAFESGKVINRFFRRQVHISLKSDLSPVTIADQKAEELMRNLIQKSFPDHGIVGEEFGIHNPDAEYKWILDPIDGTKSFISGALSFGTLIALTKNNKPLFGIIYHPILNELLLGDNISTSLNGEPVSIRECPFLSEATLLTTDHLNISKYQNGPGFEKLIRQVKLYRNWGDCYGYYLLATGYADVMIDPIMSLWDTIALVPIIKGAGGMISDYNGNDPLKGTSIVAANNTLHRKVIEILNGS